MPWWAWLTLAAGWTAAAFLAAPWIGRRLKGR